jgi:hypothetical protein
MFYTAQAVVMRYKGKCTISNTNINKNTNKSALLLAITLQIARLAVGLSFVFEVFMPTELLFTTGTAEVFWMESEVAHLDHLPRNDGGVAAVAPKALGLIIMLLAVGIAVVSSKKNSSKFFVASCASETLWMKRLDSCFDHLACNHLATFATFGSKSLQMTLLAISELILPFNQSSTISEIPLA